MSCIVKPPFSCFLWVGTQLGQVPPPLSCISSWIPVSYTHLDVYKRQILMLHWLLFCSVIVTTNKFHNIMYDLKKWRKITKKSGWILLKKKNNITCSSLAKQQYWEWQMMSFHYTLRCSVFFVVINISSVK